MAGLSLGRRCISPQIFDTLHGYAIHLIEQGLAYADHQSPMKLNDTNRSEAAHEKRTKTPTQLSCHVYA
jgi:glutamyl/glutaminyl-tRNA synthetase